MVLPHQYVDSKVRFPEAVAAPELVEAEEPACPWEAYTTERRRNDTELNVVYKNAGEGTFSDHERQSGHPQGVRRPSGRLRAPPDLQSEGESKTVGRLTRVACLTASCEFGFVCSC